MQQLIFGGRRRLSWQDAPEPKLTGPTDAIVRPLAVARCDLDYLMLKFPVSKLLGWGEKLGMVDSAIAAFGSPPFEAPFVIGHECAAEVVEVGDQVAHVRPGDRVIVPFQVSCGTCARCQRKLTAHCSATPTRISAYGLGPAAGDFGGAMADLVRVPFADAMLVPLPEGVLPSQAACTADNFCDAYRAVAPGLLELKGAPALIVGGRARSVALYSVAWALSMGAERVYYADTNQRRLELASQLGAEVFPLSRAWMFGSSAPLPVKAPITVDASVSGRGLRLAIQGTEVGGTCTSVGIHFRATTGLPLLQMYVDGITFKTGLANVRSDLPTVLAHIAAKRIDPMRIATRVAAWSDAADAFFEEDMPKLVVERPSVASLS